MSLGETAKRLCQELPSDLLGRSDDSKDVQLKSARKQLAYQRAKRQKAEEEIGAILPEKQGNQIAALWYVRAGLARPTVPIAALSEFLQDLPLDSTPSIGASSIRKARDAFCTLVLQNNKTAIGQLFARARCENPGGT